MVPKVEKIQESTYWNPKNHFRFVAEKLLLLLLLSTESRYVPGGGGTTIQYYTI
jgi:hypothetical protein